MCRFLLLWFLMGDRGQDFPEEHEGLNIEFNWSLADDDVTPHGDAFRNLSWPKLEALAKQETPGTASSSTWVQHR